MSNILDHQSQFPLEHYFMSRSNLNREISPPHFPVVCQPVPAQRGWKGPCQPVAAGHPPASC